MTKILDFTRLLSGRMKQFGMISLAALFILALSNSASADTLIVNCGTVSGPTELVAGAILCPQFNLSGQTLSQIDIAVSGGITGTITLTNGDNAAHTGIGTTTTSFNFSGLGGFTFVNPIFTASFTTGTRALSAGETLTVAGLSSAPPVLGSLGSNTTVFAPYIGGGNFAVPVSTDTFFTSGGGGGFFMAAQASNANATAQVTYTYGPPTTNPIPEPASISLMGFGLLGLGLLARKIAVVRK